MNDAKATEPRTCPYLTHEEQLCGLINHFEVTTTSRCNTFLKHSASTWQQPLSQNGGHTLCNTLIEKLVIQINSINPDRIGPSGKSVQNSKKTKFP